VTMGRTSTVVKSRYARPGSGRTTPRAHRGRAGSGSRRQIGAALRYVEMRDLGPDESAEDRALFTAATDTVARPQAREDLAQWVTSGVAYHSLVLSPGPAGAEMSADEMRVWTRHVMADLEQRLGGAVTWSAAVHRHTDHIHVHVIAAASRTGAGGKRQRVWLGRDDFTAMRQSGDRWADHQCRTNSLLREAEGYAADLLRTAALILPHGGGSGRGGSSDLDEIERSQRTRR